MAVGFLGILKTETGRIHTGWRVFLFFLLLPLFVVLLSLVPLHGMNWETLPVLVGGLLAGWALLALDGRGPGALGFHLSPGAPREALLGLGLGILVGGLVVCGMAGLGGVWWTSEEGGPAAFLRRGAAALWFFTLPAAAEEVVFRGYLLQSLTESWGALKALWITSVVFGLLHLSNPNTSPVGIANIVVAGLFLGVVYLKTASLWWATGAHLGWNWTLGFLADLPVSGLDLADSPLYQGVPRGADWVSGGAFGPEGSLVATVGLGLAAFLVWKSPRFRPDKDALETHPLILSAPDLRTVWGSVGEGPERELSDSGRKV